jgi:hypothetical protein
MKVNKVLEVNENSERIRENIFSVDMGAYFHMAIVAIGAILLAGAFSVFIIWLWQAVLYKESLMTWGEIMLEFVMYEVPLMLLLVAVGLFLVFTKRIYQFDPDAKESRVLCRFYQWEWGKWEPLVLEGYCLAFQRYGQSYNYNYGGIYKKNIFEYVYDLRLVGHDGKYKSIVSASDFQAVAQILLMGRKMGEIYGLPFNDYVMDLIRKQYRNAKSGGVI